MKNTAGQGILTVEQMVANISPNIKQQIINLKMY
jgi:hypothetical protein